MAHTAGDIINGTYRLDSLVAKGGMGLVFKGTHLRLGNRVALKILHPQLREYPTLVSRFMQEAYGIADITHRNIVRIIDVGVSGEGIPFFVMELLAGENLKDRLELRGRMRPGEIFPIMVQALSGLAVLHRRGIVHRDIKPGNIFVAREEDGTELVKILDFGVSKFQLLETIRESESTSLGTVMGTPVYMSPEQASGKVDEIDTRSDLYSCGMIVYRALTGINPFAGGNYNQVITSIVSAPVHPPSSYDPSLPAEVDDIVMRAIDRDRGRRYGDCQELIDALRGSGFGGSEVVARPSTSVPPPPASTDAAAPAEGQEGSGSDLTRSVTVVAKKGAWRSPFFLAAAGVLVLLAVATLGAVGYFTILRGSHGAAPAKPAAPVIPATTAEPEVEPPRPVDTQPQEAAVATDTQEEEVIAPEPPKAKEKRGKKSRLLKKKTTLFTEFPE